MPRSNSTTPIFFSARAGSPNGDSLPQQLPYLSSLKNPLGVVPLPAAIALTMALDAAKSCSAPNLNTDMPPECSHQIASDKLKQVAFELRTPAVIRSKAECLKRACEDLLKVGWGHLKMREIRGRKPASEFGHDIKTFHKYMTPHLREDLCFNATTIIRTTAC